MKVNQHILYIAIAVALGACSSSSEPDLQGDVIEFGTPVVALGADEDDSRAQRLDALPAGAVFGVSGYCVPVVGESGVADYRLATLSWVDKNNMARADVMHARPVMFDGTKCVYQAADGTYSEPPRWYGSAGETSANPADFRYTFAAYYPYDDYFTLPAEDAVGVPEIGFTMPFEAKDYESEPLDPTKVKDAMVAMTADRLRNVDNVGTVPLRFRHLLCGLRFQINNFNTSDKVEISSITLRGSFYRSGTISLAGTQPQLSVAGEDLYSGTFYFVDPNSPVVVEPNMAVIAGAKEGEGAASEGVAVLLLPHFEGETDRSYLGRNKVIEVAYSFQGHEGVKQINFALSRRPVAGTVYTVNLSFVGEQMMVSFSDNANNDWTWDDVHTGNNTIK